MSDDDQWTVVENKKKKDQIIKQAQKKANRAAALQQQSGNLSGPASASYNQGEAYPSFHPAHQDWNDVVVRKRRPHPVKYRGPSDQSRHLNKIDGETENFHHPRVKKSLSQKIQDYRRDHQLTQVQLAQKLNLKVEVVNSYEKGSAISDPQIISRFHRLLNQRERKPTTSNTTTDSKQ